jgi:Rieske Fe-S protein
MSAMPTKNNPSLSRRTFLKILLAASGALTLAGLLRFWDYQDEPTQPMEFDLGPASQHPSGSRTLIPEAQAILLHLPDGFIAFEASCPHLGCTLEISGHEFNCPCHRSRFDQNGKVLNGPATHELVQMRLEHLANDHLVLHRN